MLHYSSINRTNGKHNGLYTLSFSNNNANDRQTCKFGLASASCEVAADAQRKTNSADAASRTNTNRILIKIQLFGVVNARGGARHSSLIFAPIAHFCVPPESGEGERKGRERGGRREEILPAEAHARITGQRRRIKKAL